MDLNDVEKIDVNALGNTDTITVNDLSGTDVAEMNINLAGTIGGDGWRRPGRYGDRQRHQRRRYRRRVRSGNARSRSSGLPPGPTSPTAKGPTTVSSSTRWAATTPSPPPPLPAGTIKLTIDGGAGNDTILGSQGDDTLLGGDGNDFVFGDNGNDLARLGAGDDVFQWNPGDGNDTVEGSDGTDTMLFFGANIAENIDISANGGRVLFFRDIANVTMDLNDVEHIDFRALGDADNIVVGDLSGTDVTEVNIDLRGPNGGGDGAKDTVTVNGTNGDDAILVAGDAGGIAVLGLQAAVNIFFPEQANDRLTVNGLGGDDVINASSLEADGIQLTMNGGSGEDILIGSEGDDLFNGGDGNDTAHMGAGDDMFVWNPGDDNDTVEGQAGVDTLLFNGANIARGNRHLGQRRARAPSSATSPTSPWTLTTSSTIDFNALGGVDKIVVNDLSGTDVTEVNVNLASTIDGTAGDDAADTIFINATNGDDVIVVVGDASGVTILRSFRHDTHHPASRPPTTVSSSMDLRAMTSSRRRGSRRAPSSSPPMAATATTCWSAATATIRSMAMPETTY